MLNLTILHSIHLTRDQRYALHDGKSIQVDGCSIPVWFDNKLTSEPGYEVFCRYQLHNPRTDVPIQILDDGYEISLPFREGTRLEISNEEWRHLNLTDPDKLDTLYRETLSEASSKNLLDVKDGGCQSFVYREQNKVQYGEKTLKIMHYVSIHDISMLTNSLINLDNL